MGRWWRDRVMVKLRNRDGGGSRETRDRVMAEEVERQNNGGKSGETERWWRKWRHIGGGSRER